MAIAIIAFVSCKNNGSDKNKTGDSTANQNTDVKVNGNNQTKGKYQIKSGVVSYTTKIQGIDEKITISFDDYGNKEATETDVEMMGISQKTRTFNADGFTYSLNLSEKTGTKTKSYANQNIDFNNLTDEISKEMNIKKVGTETIMGKSCDVYTMDYSSMNMKGKFWVWKGIALKSDISTNGMEIVMTATEVKENTNVDQSLFTVPADFKITEM